MAQLALSMRVRVRSFAPRYKPDVACAYKPSAGGSNRGGVGSWELRGERMGDFLMLTVQLT